MRSTALVAATMTVAAAFLTGCSATDSGSPAPTASATATNATAPGTATAGSTAPGTATPGGSAIPGATGTPAATVGRVTLSRTGGIAGASDTVTVEADGRWTATDRAGASRSGQLSGADLDRLRGLAGTATRAGGNADPTPGRCADTFAYRLVVDATVITWTDCPTGTRPTPAASALAELLFRATAR